jgi:hypothetical protein
VVRYRNVLSNLTERLLHDHDVFAGHAWTGSVLPDDCHLDWSCSVHEV